MRLSAASRPSAATTETRFDGAAPSTICGRQIGPGIQPCAAAGWLMNEGAFERHASFQAEQVGYQVSQVPRRRDL
jgi:hypothetical protein